MAYAQGGTEQANVSSALPPVPPPLSSTCSMALSRVRSAGSSGAGKYCSARRHLACARGEGDNGRQAVRTVLWRAASCPACRPPPFGSPSPPHIPYNVSHVSSPTHTSPPTCSQREGMAPPVSHKPAPSPPSPPYLQPGRGDAIVEVLGLQVALLGSGEAL